jgi:translation elongation factor EF-Ts
MIDNCVVVIRTKSEGDVLAILCDSRDNKLKIQHPFYAHVNPASGNVTMVPFCPLSDETFFEMDVAETRFVVVASESISAKFIAMTNTIEPQQDDELDEPTYMVSQLIDGNTTKH